MVRYAHAVWCCSQIRCIIWVIIMMARYPHAVWCCSQIRCVIWVLIMMARYPQAVWCCSQIRCVIWVLIMMARYPQAVWCCSQIRCIIWVLIMMARYPHSLVLFTNQEYNLGPNYDGQVSTCCLVLFTNQVHILGPNYDDQVSTCWPLAWELEWTKRSWTPSPPTRTARTCSGLPPLIPSSLWRVCWPPRPANVSCTGRYCYSVCVAPSLLLKLVHD